MTALRTTPCDASFYHCTYFNANIPFISDFYFRGIEIHAYRTFDYDSPGNDSVIFGNISVYDGLHSAFSVVQVNIVPVNEFAPTIASKILPEYRVRETDAFHLTIEV